MDKPNLVKKYYYLLRCPEEGEALVYSEKYLECCKCKKKYNILDTNFVDLRPDKPIQNSNSGSDKYEEKYFRYYNKIFCLPKSFGDSKTFAWGAPELLIEKHLKRKNRFCSLIKEQIVSNKILLDVSGGAGWFTLSTAGVFNLVIHNDLDSQNLAYVHKKAETGKIDNILFVRSDIFRNVYKSGIADTIICTDTLIYGNYQVGNFLEKINEILDVSGIAYIDFYNKMHWNPFHKRFMKGYFKEQCKKMILENGFEISNYKRFVQEDLSLINELIPATRHVFKLIKK